MGHRGLAPPSHIRERVRVMEVYQPAGWSHIHWYTHTATTVSTMVVVCVLEVGAKGPCEAVTTGHHAVVCSRISGFSTSAIGPGDSVEAPFGMALHGTQLSAGEYLPPRLYVVNASSRFIFGSKGQALAFTVTAKPCHFTLTNSTSVCGLAPQIRSIMRRLKGRPRPVWTALLS